MRYRLSIMLILATAIVTHSSGALAQRPKKEDAKLIIGDKAPDFSLPGTDGKTYTLKNFSGSPILLMIFTANHCPTAQAYEDRMQELQKDYAGKGVALAVISPNDPKALRLDELGYTDLGDTMEDMKIRARDRGFTFPYLYDGETQSMSKQYGPVSTPHIFIFDKDRILRYAGRIDDHEDPAKVTSHDARNALDALIAGKPVPVPVTKTFGCSVKWSDKRSLVQAADEKWAQEPVTLETIDEQGIAALVANKTGKLRLINMWATWCGPCVTEFPELVAINRMYMKRPFEMITISADDPTNREAAQKFLKEQQAANLNYIFHTDNKYAMIEALDSEWQGAIPYTILVEPGGKIIFREMGEINPLELKKKIVTWVGRYYHSKPGNN